MPTRSDILELVRQYQKEKPTHSFDAGKTYLPAAKAYYDSDEVVALVSAALDMKWVDGDIVKQFEREMARFMGVRFAIMTNSGSSANLLAISALTSHLFQSKRLQPGDEVITVAAGFPTTVNPIIQNGLVPVFVDINVGTYNTSPHLVDQAITEKTKAIFIAHTLGNPYDIDEIKEIAKLHNLWVIEDCCFVAGTRILTSKGEVPIEQIKVGDLVMTRSGYKEVLASGMTGKKKVITKLGLTGTPNHPVFTTSGIKRLDALSASDIIYVWKKNTSTITEQSIQDTQNQVNDTCRSTFGQVVEKIENLFIHKFGETPLGRFLRDMKSIIEMATPSITKLVTWNFYPNQHTPAYTGKKMTEEEKHQFLGTWKSLENKQGYGIRVMTQKNSIVELPNSLGKISQLIQQFVKFVGKNIKHFFQAGQKIAPANAKTEVEVYNLTVDGCHEFIANGILVHNCDALGAELDGRKIGSFGNVSTTSFYPAHLMAVGEGGMVFTDSPMIAKAVRSFRDWGRDCWCLPGKDNTCGKRFCQTNLGELPDGFDHKYVYSHVGYNLKSTDLQAAIGLEQLKKLPDFIEDRKYNWEYLREEFKKHGLDKYFILPTQLQKSSPAWFGFILTIKGNCKFTRTELVEFLEEHKIGSRNLFAGNITKQPAYIGKNWRISDTVSGLPHTDIVMNRTFWIGCHPSMTKKMLDYIVETILEFVKNYE